MGWALLYVIGIIVMTIVQKKGSNASIVSSFSEDELTEWRRGRLITILAWPVFLPIVIIMWLQTYAEDAAERRRYDKWQGKGRR